VQPNIEVKSIRTKDEIPVFPKDLKNGGILVGARVLDRDYYSQVEIFGWMFMDDVATQGYWSVEKDFEGHVLRECWRVPLNKFNAVDPIESCE
jgi:hypothetical protein